GRQPAECGRQGRIFNAIARDAIERDAVEFVGTLDQVDPTGPAQLGQILVPDRAEQVRPEGDGAAATVGCCAQYPGECLGDQILCLSLVATGQHQGEAQRGTVMTSVELAKGISPAVSDIGYQRKIGSWRIVERRHKALGIRVALNTTYRAFRQIAQTTVDPGLSACLMFRTRFSAICAWFNCRASHRAPRSWPVRLPVAPPRAPVRYRPWLSGPVARRPQTALRAPWASGAARARPSLRR